MSAYYLRAWQLALEEARYINPPREQMYQAPPPYIIEVLQQSKTKKHFTKDYLSFKKEMFRLKIQTVVIRCIIVVIIEEVIHQQLFKLHKDL
jgi:hypothetical protein